MLWDVMINNPHEPMKIRIEKVKVKDFSKSRRENQEEKRYMNTLKFFVRSTTEITESLENEEDDSMTEWFSKFSIFKRKANLNFARNKRHSRKQDECVVPSSTECERE